MAGGAAPVFLRAAPEVIEDGRHDEEQDEEEFHQDGTGIVVFRLGNRSAAGAVAAAIQVLCSGRFPFCGPPVPDAPPMKWTIEMTMKIPTCASFIAAFWRGRAILYHCRKQMVERSSVTVARLGIRKLPG